MTPWVGFFISALFLGFHSKIIAAAFKPTMNNTKASCENARIVDNAQKFCPMASWSSAHVYYAANFTDYSAGSPLPDSLQNTLAVNTFNSFKSNYDKAVSIE